VATPEIKKYFETRTKRHISLVQKYCGIIAKKFPEMEGIIARGKAHDASKYGKDELEPYIWLTWQYKCKDDGVDPKLPEGMQARIDRAAEHHILNNAHHPEFHQSKKTGLLAKGDRDGIPDKAIDATKMSDLDIGEMVADWCAMSEERGNTPKSWADKTVNKRWLFTPKQTKLIYKLIGTVWKGPKKMRKTANQIADEALTKLGFSVTDKGHAFDADMADIDTQRYLAQARRLQEEDAIGHANPDGSRNWANLLATLRFGTEDGDHPTASARHSQYVADQHRKGENAYNPFGGALTPHPDEVGGSTSLFGPLGKVGPAS